MKKFSNFLHENTENTELSVKKEKINVSDAINKIGKSVSVILNKIKTEKGGQQAQNTVSKEPAKPLVKTTQDTPPVQVQQKTQEISQNN